MSVICTRIFILLAILGPAAAPAPAAAAQEYAFRADRAAMLEGLQAQIEAIAQGADVAAGIAIEHLETGAAVGVNAGRLFPMASTYKIPMAVKILERVDAGELELDTLIEFRQSDYVRWSLAERWIGPGARLPLYSVLELMLQLSDNTATDVALRVAGGGDAVTAKLRALGVNDMIVARGTSDLLIDYFGYEPFTRMVRADGVSFSEALEEILDGDGAEAYEAFRERTNDDPEFHAAFLADPRDQATPAAMNALLKAIFEGRALSPENTETLLDIMRRSETGANRIRGLLPEETEVAQKTGTLTGGGGVINNAGIITLPDDKGHVAITVFVRHRLDEDTDSQARVIAEAARAAYDFFVTNVVTE